VFLRDIHCLRNVSINTLHEGDDVDDDNNNNNNNNNNIYLVQLGCYSVAVGYICTDTSYAVCKNSTYFGL